MAPLTIERARAILKTPSLLRKDPDATVIDDHRWLHLWSVDIQKGNKLFINKEELKELHDVYVAEFNRRGLNHQSPIELGLEELVKIGEISPTNLMILRLMSSMLRQALDSRKPFILDPEFISFVGSSVSSKPHPNDVDILFKCSRNDEFRARLLESMPSFLKDRVEMVWEADGPMGPYVPGYQLWAIPLEKTEVKEPRYTIAPLSPFRPPQPEAKMDRSSIFELLEDDYYVAVVPNDAVRLTVHRKENEVTAFNEELNEFDLPDAVDKELVAINEPYQFIADGFLAKEGILYILDLPWWRDSQHTSQSTRVRYEFMFRLPISEHVRFVPFYHFESRKETIEQLRHDDGRYLILPGSATYAVDSESEWIEFDGSKPIKLAAEASDTQIKELVDGGKWEDKSAAERFSLMTKRRGLEPGYPYAQLKTIKKGYSAHEVFGVKSVGKLAEEIFRVPNKIATEVKIDGFRTQVHKKGDEGHLFTESGHEITKQLPGVIGSVKALHAREVILDSEATPYGEDLVNLGRQGAAPAFAEGAKEPVDDSLWALHVFDILWLDGKDLHGLPYEERRKILHGLELPVRDMPKEKGDFRNHLWENNVYWATSAEQMVKFSEQVSAVPGSEGAMFKQADSEYRLSGSTPLWSKMKVSYEVDALVVGVITEGNIHRYVGAIGPVKKDAEAEAPIDDPKGKKFIKYKGRVYGILGKSFNTPLKAELGDIIRVSVKWVDKLDEDVYHWFQPKIVEVREDKVKPDPVSVAETIWKTSQAQSRRVRTKAAYLVSARYGAHSPVACCEAPWVAMLDELESDSESLKLKDNAFKYFQNGEDLFLQLKEEGIDVLVGTKISRESVDQLWSLGIRFLSSGAETIADHLEPPSCLGNDIDLPENTEIDVEELREFYDSIRSDFTGMKLECGAIVPLERVVELADLYLTYPDESKTWKYVMQFHIRGLSVHGDLRAEINRDQLIGWTWDTGKSLIKVLLRRVKDEQLAQVGLIKAQLKDMPIREVSKKLASTSEGRALKNALTEKTQELSDAQLRTLCEEVWREEVEPILANPNLKILTQTKAPESHEWLTYEGEVPPGAVGATAELEGRFFIMDRGTIQYGAQKGYYHEYFLNGGKLKGRFFVRRITTRPEWQVKESFAWMTFRGKETEPPYTISRRAVQKGWMPPKGVSAIPKEIRKQIPDEYRYWERENAKEIRDNLVNAISKRQVSIKLAQRLEFSVKRVWHKGPEVQRGMPIVRYWIIIHDGKKVLDAWDFGQDADPLEQEGLVARRKSGKGLEDLIKTTGELPPNHPASQTKRLENHHDTSDEGTITIIGDSKNMLRAKFNGGSLKGLYVFVKEDPSADTWVFEKSELPQPKKMLLSAPQVIHLAFEGAHVELIEDLLLVSGAAIKPGEVIGADGRPALFTKDGIKQLWPSMVRQPIVVLHGDLKGDVIGFVNKIHYDEERGWGVVDQGVIWHPLGIKLIMEGDLPDYSIEVIPEAVWDAEHKRDVVMGGRCIGLAVVTKGACTTCHIDEARMGAIAVAPGKIYKFGMSLEQYLAQRYWGQNPYSTQDLAEELDRPRSTIDMWMDQAKIPRRSLLEARHLRLFNDERERKYGGRVTLTALGTGAFTDIPRDDCPQCKEARAGGKSKRNYSAMLLSIGDDHLLIGAPKGINNMLGLKGIKPKWVLIEHMHEDAVYGLHELRPLKPVVFASEDLWAWLRKHYKAASGEKGEFEEIYNFERRIVADGKRFRAGGFIIEPVKVEHAKPGDPATLGFKVTIGDKTIFYCSDLLAIPDRERRLKGVDVYIGDGSSMAKGIVNERDGKQYGHAPMVDQIKWATEANIPRIYFTQIGHVGLTHSDLNERLRDQGPNIEALYDGEQLSLGGGAPGAMHSKSAANELLEGKRSIIVRPKPYSEYAKQVIFLLGGNRVMALYVEGYPEGPFKANKIKVEMKQEHGMTNEEWVKEIGDSDEVWIYRPRIVKRYEPPREYDPPKIFAGPYIHDVKILPEVG